MSVRCVLWAACLAACLAHMGAGQMMMDAPTSPAAASSAPPTPPPASLDAGPAAASSAPPASLDARPTPPPVCPSGVDKAPTHVALSIGPARVAKAGTNASFTPAMVINGSLVGPRLDFSAGDDVSVDVTNRHPTEPTTIHWHGMTLADSPGNGLGLWADGVDGLTQAAIPPGATFRYRFTALGGGGDAGSTLWYHAHVGAQYGDGVRGPLIIHAKRASQKERDNERLLFISDASDVWSADLMKSLESGGMAAGMGGGMSPMGGGGGPAAMPSGGPAPAMAQMAHGRKLRAGDGGMGGGMGGGGMGGGGMGGGMPVAPAATPAAAGHGGTATPATAAMADATTPACPPVPDLSDFPFYGTLVNGRGYALTDPAAGVAGVGPDGSGLAGAPDIITVRKGATHRVRIVQAAASWGYNISVAGHVWPNIIALDGYPAKLDGPASKNLIRGGSLILQPGETADVELTADAPVGNYWIRVASAAGPGGAAILHYEGAPDPLADPALGPPPLNFPAGACPAAGGVPGVVDLKNATGVRAGRGQPRPPRTAARTLGIWLTANAADPSKPENVTIPGYALAEGAGPPPPGCEALAMAANGSMSGPVPKYCWGLNWVVFTPPPVLPVLAGNKNSLAGAGSHNTMQPAGSGVPGTKLAVDEVVDVLFVNPTSMAHPMHVHGRGGWLLGSGMGDLPLVDGAVNVGDARLNLKDPPRRNTVPVAATLPGEPGPAWAVLRMSQGPGIVPLHCHLEPHAAAGMVTYFVVGDEWVVPDNLECAGVARVAVDESGGPVLRPYAV